KDTANVYIYVSGGAPVRSPNELPGCSDLAPDKDPNSERFRIEVIQVPLAHPEQAHVVTKPAILADLTEPAVHGEAPEDIAAAAADSNFAFWHSATFNNDGTKVLFTDEWGGGLAPKCRVTDKPEWGADAIFTVAHDTMKFQSYYKLPAPQTSNENCVAHNGSLIPVPGR